MSDGDTSSDYSRRTFIKSEVMRMRILVISNIYPPYYLGGYELACAEVVDALRRRGHQVTVLTAWRGLRRPQMQVGVVRLLQVRFPFDQPYHNAAARLSWYL